MTTAVPTMKLSWKLSRHVPGCCCIETGSSLSILPVATPVSRIIACAIRTVSSQSPGTPCRAHQQFADTEPVSCQPQAGKKAKKGIHSGKEAPLHHVNDVSVPGSAARAKQYLPFLSRGKTNGIVEHVVNGHRLRVRACPAFGL